MVNLNTSQKPSGRRRPKKNKGVFTTKSGTTIRLNRSLWQRWKTHKEAKARRRAIYLNSLPKNRFKRMLYRMHPKRLAQYWFSRDGAVMALKIAGIGIVVGFVLIVGLFAYFRKDLPNITDLSGNIGATVTYYDRTGQTVLWQDSEAIRRVPVSGDNISDYLKNASIAIEDKNFYKHGAFDVGGIARAGFNDIFNRSGGLQGGSTITQQLVKLNQDWTHDRTVTRKVKELILSVELEREYSKNDILTGYLNIAPYGGVEYGAEAAARDYFGTTAKDMSLAQAALLAGIPQSPTYYSPYNALEDPEAREALLGRQHYILDQMVDQGMITAQQAEEAKQVDVLAQVQPRSAKYENIRAPYFVLAAKKELEETYGSQTVQLSGWKVTTTLDLDLQTLADEQVAKGLAQVKKQKGDNIAFAAMDVETGQMVALVGGVDFNNKEYGQLNYAQIPLPPGSSFKPYDYVAMMENTTNTGAGSVLYDEQSAIPGYPCTNKSRPGPTNPDANCLWDYDFRYPGPLTIRYSLAGSRNVPAVKAMLTAGVNKTIDTAEAMGLVSGYKCYADETLTSEAPCYGSSAIGDGAYLHLDEHVNGYATMSRLGKYVPKTYILKVEDARGKVINEWKQPKGEEVIRPDSAYIAMDMLSDPRASYMTIKAQDFNGWKFALKTGTTNDDKDGWMMGTSTKYAAGVWVGHHTRGVVMNRFMENMTLPIWKGWMDAAHKRLSTPVNWQKPGGIQTLPAFIVSQNPGGAARTPSPENDIYPSWYKPPARNNSSRTIDVVSNKLATSCTPEAAKRTESGGGSANIFSADIFKDGGQNNNTGNQNTSENDDIHNCNDTKPSITLTAPATCSSSLNCIFTVTVTQGTHALSSDKFPGTVNLLVNGQQVESQSVSTSPSTVTFLYNPNVTSPQQATVEAQVIDSVLYSATQSTTVEFTPAAPPTP